MLNSLYLDGNSLFHRLPTKVKLGLLLLVGLLLAFSHSVVVQGLATLLFGIIYYRLGLGLKQAFARIRPVVVTIVLFALINALVLTPFEALVNGFRLLAVVLLAATITATTSISAFMEALMDILSPFERLGMMKAADVSLAIGLVLRFVPDIARRYQALKEAHVARGLKVRPLQMIGPLIILTLKEADSIADAIDARGIRGP